MTTIADIQQKITDANAKQDQIAALIAASPTQAQLDAAGAGLDQLLTKQTATLTPPPAPTPTPQ